MKFIGRARVTFRPIRNRPGSPENFKAREVGSAQQQIATATAVGTGGIILGLVGLIVSLLALRKSSGRPT